MYHHDEAVASLDRMRHLAAYDLFNQEPAAELDTFCQSTAQRCDMPIAAVHPRGLRARW
jgi:hypothetical protein